MEDNSKVVINICGGDNHIYPTAATVNNFFGDQFAEDVIKANRKEVLINQEAEIKGGVEEDIDNPLKRYIPNKDDFDYVVEYAKVCKSPKDINNCIVVPLKKKGYKDVLLTNPPFLNALIPYLTNYESVKNAESISRALRK